MAREYGRLWLSIWSDPEFTALPLAPQWLFCALLSQPGLTTCGVQPYTPNRWTSLVPDLTARRTEKAIADLEAARFIVVDRQTDEVALRSHLRYDKPLRGMNTAKAVARTWREVRSPALRRVVLIEMQRLHDEGEFEDWLGWKEVEVKALLATDPRTVE